MMDSRHEYSDSPNLPETELSWVRSFWIGYVTGILCGLVAGLILVSSLAHARWSPQLAQEWGEIPEDVVKWFKQQVSPKTGIPCCDVGDGYKTSWAIEGDHYVIPSRNNPKVWIPVPNDVVINNTGNPNGNAVVWWTHIGEDEIRCFVPGGGV